MDEQENQENAIGFVLLGRDHACCAQTLIQETKDGKLSLRFDAPIDYLFAHAFELQLKGCLLYQGQSEENIIKHGHHILNLYDEMKSKHVLDGLISKVEVAVQKRCKDYLLKARGDHIAKIERAGFPSDLDILANEIPSESEVAQNLPELREQVKWLSDRHNRAGSAFRYLQRRMDSLPVFCKFGLQDNIVWKYSFWACEEIHEHFRGFHINNQS